jgi:hypothetical protein
MESNGTKLWANYVILKTAQSKHSPNSKKSPNLVTLALT